MATSVAEQAIADALGSGRALFKFISPNDAGVTGSHQCGFYLPKGVWGLYTIHPPQSGVNSESPVRILWQDGRVTDSRIKWYGVGTRSEYRLTKFGRGFTFLTSESVGDLFILVPDRSDRFFFRAYVLDFDEDIDEFQAALGIEAIANWGVYEHGQIQQIDEDDCIDIRFRRFTEAVSDFPVTRAIAEEAQEALSECMRDYGRLSADQKLMRCITGEYSLFKMIERKLTTPEISRVFRDVDDFIKTASSIMNRRKSRAGKSLEHHVEKLLRDAGIPFEAKPKIDGRVEPDILIPGKAAYEDSSYPTDRLFIVGLKTTCKDRWRQVLNEGRRVQRKHILTLQQGISANQLAEMKAANVTLVVPKSLQSFYPSGTGTPLLTIEGFFTSVRRKLN